MNTEPSKTKRLIHLLRKLASITHNDQPHSTLVASFNIHNHRNAHWDDIWFFSGADTEKKQPILKIALMNLSHEDRSQLDFALHQEEGYTGRSEHLPAGDQKTALFKFIHKSAETNIKSITTSE